MPTHARIAGWTLATLLGGCAPLAAQAGPAAPPEPAPYIQVSGSAQVQVPSDRAVLSLAVETQADNARAASQENARRMDAVVRALKPLVSDTGRVETWGYTLQPRYRYPQGGAPVIEGYTVVNNVRVTLDDVTRVGAVIDAGIAAGANRVASLDFQAKDTQAAREEAMKQAVARARGEAAAIAQAMGVALGPPLEVNGGTQEPSPVPQYRAVAMEASQARAPTPIEPGQQTVSANVSVKYRIGSRAP